MNITLYKGQTCPKCKIIAAKLDKEGIPYKTVMDVDYMIASGITVIPTLEVDGQRFVDVKACNNWINSYSAQRHINIQEVQK